MAASVKIEFDDGSRVISQSVQEAAGSAGVWSKANATSKRPSSCSLDEFYEIPRTTNFIADGSFRRIALQFPDELLREAPEVLWTLRARLRKRGGAQDGDDDTDPLIFVTGDTSYGSCCVDEVSAQHLKADAIVHYGRACLSPTNSSIPVLYVFGRGELDVADLASNLLAGPLSTEDHPVLLLYDVIYAHAVPELLDALGGQAPRASNLVVGHPTTAVYLPAEEGSHGEQPGRQQREGGGCRGGGASTVQRTVSGCGPPTEDFGQSEGTADGDSARPAGSQVSGTDRESGRHCCGNANTCFTGDSRIAERTSSTPREVPHVHRISDATEGVSAVDGVGLTTGLSEERHLRIGGLEVAIDDEENLKRHRVVFVGGEGRQLSNVLLRCNACVDRLRYDPALPRGERLIEDAGKGNRDLMRRYYLVQRAKEAAVFGIVVGTLGVQRYSSVVRSVRAMIEAAGRKAYTLAVGKINVAKLANFAEVEVFCLIACAENSLLDSKEFHAPVITPLELEVALGIRDWDGFYSTDFDDLRGIEGASSSPRSPTSDRPAGSSSSPQEKTQDRSVGCDTDGSDSDDDRPFFSLVSGSFKKVESVARGSVALGPSGPKGIEGGSESNALAKIGDRSLVEWSSPAADFLEKREFRGLDASIGQTEVTAAVDGQSGIASDYGGT